MDIPVNGPLDSRRVFATVSMVYWPFNAARVMMATTSRSMPPTTNRASKPRKA